MIGLWLTESQPPLHAPHKGLIPLNRWERLGEGDRPLGMPPNLSFLGKRESRELAQSRLGLGGVKRRHGGTPRWLRLLHKLVVVRMSANPEPDQPIFDFHCHLPAQDIAENRKFRSLTEAWLSGDHYKWRAMRASGVPERLITGDGSDRDKFAAWAAVAPRPRRTASRATPRAMRRAVAS